MKIDIASSENNSSITIIKVEGRIDAISVSDFEEKTLPLSATEATGFVIDFAKVEYISSAGLRAILKIAKSCKEVKKKVALCNLSATVREVLKISGFDLILKICNDLQAAEDCVAKD
ncbi:MAG: STAS domain-containing protein [Succinivibrio sp.]|nr:STAS domain-containing protein [Succinivibrio sp.]